MASGRTPEQLLTELGADLDAAFRRDPVRRRTRTFGVRSCSGRRRVLVALVTVAVMGVSTAAATRSLLSSSPPVPPLAPFGIMIADGAVGGETWTLSVSRCSQPVATGSVVLRVGSGGAGTPCGPAVQPPGVFYDARHGNAVAFGLLPAGTARVELVLGTGRRDVTPVKLDDAGSSAARLADGTVAYVVSLPTAANLTALAAFDSHGHLTLVCQRGSCVEP